MSGWWWWPAGPGHGHERPVLFFPPAGAEQNIVRPLLEHVAGLRLGVLRLPGRGARRDEEPPGALPLLVDALVVSVARLGGPPPMLVGHSFGGLLAYAVAAELEARGGRVGRLVTLASPAPRVWAGELVADDRAHPGTGAEGFVARRTARILGHGGVPAEVLGHPELAAQVRATVAVDVGLSHGGFGDARLRCPVTAIAARDDPVLPAASVAGWSEVTVGEYETVTVPGDHFFYRHRPRDLAVRLRMEVAALEAG